MQIYTTSNYNKKYFVSSITKSSGDHNKCCNLFRACVLSEKYDKEITYSNKYFKVLQLQHQNIHSLENKLLQSELLLN